MSEFRDPAESARASFEPDLATAIDSPEDIILEVLSQMSIALPNTTMSMQWFRQTVASVAVQALRTAHRDGQLAALFDGLTPSRMDLEMVARLLAEFVDADNPRLHAKCMAFVFGLSEESETQIARSEGIGKAAVSKRCIRIKESMGVPPGRGMKSEAAIVSYRRRQKGKRNRPAAQPWPFTSLLTRIYE